jgi:hypothetical protein
MTFTLFSRILPHDVASIIFNFVKLQKTQKIYWEQLYSPASLILENLIKIYSDYDKVFNPICYDIDRIKIITIITNKFASQGLIQKNIYIYMDEYIDNLHTLKKHLQFHFKDTRQLLMLNKSIIECLDKFLD